MTAVDRIKAAQQAELVDKDGKPIHYKFLPPQSEEQIDALQKSLGQPLPRELRELLAFCSGILCCLDIDFTDRRKAFEAKEIFPDGLPLATDGSGNFWVVDLTPDTAETAPVFFACHDPPVILFQSGDVTTFLSEIFRMDTPPYKSLVVEVLGDELFQVWERNPNVISQATAASSSDSALSAFASQLPPQFQIVDLRNVSPGMGFSWGRYGPQTEIRRYGHERIFAYAKPPKMGLITKLLDQ